MRIALLWHSANSGNLGVGALTVADMALLREAADLAGAQVEFVIVGWLDDRPVYPQVAGVPVVGLTGRRLIHPRGLASALRRCDLVVDIGAGDSFADIYGKRRMLFLLASKAAALAVGTPLVLAPQTFGPFASTAGRLAAERIIAASRRAFARDEASVASIRSAGARAHVELTTDVAFRLPFDPAPRDDSAVTVGVGVSALLYNGGYTGDDQFGLALDYPVFVKRILQDLADRDGVRVVLVPHVIAPEQPVEDDLALSRHLADQFGLEPPPHFGDPVAAKSFISGCDVLIGSRMHACIAAVSTGVATIPVAYSRKFEGLFGSLGYPHTVDATEVGTDVAVERVLALFENRDQLTEEAKAAAALADRRLDSYVKAMAEEIGRLRAEARGAA